MGRDQNLERTNVEQPIFRKSETSNIQITKIWLLDFFFKFMSYIYLRLFELFEHSKCMIIYRQIRNS